MKVDGVRALSGEIQPLPPVSWPGGFVGNVYGRPGAIWVRAEDAAVPLRCLREMAQTYGADPRRIVLTGVSAGAHLALLAAFQSPVQPAAVVNFYAPSNLGP